MSAPIIHDHKTRAIIGYNPPQPGQKFRFKPDTVIEFKEVYYKWLGYSRPYAWIFIDNNSELYFYPKEIVKYLTDKHLKPI